VTRPIVEWISTLMFALLSARLIAEAQSGRLLRVSQCRRCSGVFASKLLGARRRRRLGLLSVGCACGDGIGDVSLYKVDTRKTCARSESEIRYPIAIAEHAPCTVVLHAGGGVCRVPAVQAT